MGQRNGTISQSSTTLPQSWPEASQWDEARRTHDLYNLFVDGIRDYGIFLLDPGGHIISWNAGMERVLGYSEAEIINQPYAIMFTPEDRARDAPAQLLEITRLQGKAQDSHWLVRKDGTLFWGECTTTAQYDDAGSLRGFGKVTRDATQHKLSEERQALHYAVSHVLIGTASPEETYSRVLRTVGEGLGWDFGALWRVDQHGQVLRCHARWTKDAIDIDDFSEVTRAFTFPPGIGVPGRVWSTGEPLWVSDVQNDHNFPRIHAAARAGLHAAFGFPLRSETAILGVIEFFRHIVRPPDEDLLRTVATLGNQIGLFLELLETEEAARKSEAHKAMIVETALDGFVSMDQEGHITEFNPAAERMFGYSHDEAIGQDFTELLISPAARAQQAAWLSELFREREDPLIGHRVEVTAIRSDRTEFPLELTVTQAPAAGPIMLVGHLHDITERRSLEASQEELRTQSQARTDREALINRIGHIIRSPLDYQTMQKEVIAILCDVLHADRCFFAHYDFSRDSAIIDRDWYRNGLSSVMGVYPLSKFLVDPEARSSLPGTQVIADTHSGPWPEEMAPALDFMPMRSVINVPLQEEGRQIGALVVAMAEIPRAWTPEELSLVEHVATQTYPALESARQLRRDHEIAVALQEALMPVIPDTLAGLDLAHYYKAALDEASVGGDFSDAFLLNETSPTLVIGDVSGKGLAAASQVSTVRNMLRCLLIRESNLVDAATQLNNIIAGNDLLSGFATLFVGVFDTQTQTLAYVSCGHEPALLRRADGRIEELMPTGMAIGVQSDSPYRANLVSLAPRDLLFLYTDGLTDSGPDHRHLLDLPGLERIIEGCGEPESAGSFVSRVIARVAEFARFGFGDDVCVLAAMVKP